MLRVTDVLERHSVGPAFFAKSGMWKVKDGCKRVTRPHWADVIFNGEEECKRMLDKIEKFAASDNVEGILKMFYKTEMVKDKMGGNFVNS